VYAIELFNTVFFAFLVGSGAFFVMLVMLGFVVRFFGKDASRSEAEIHSALNKDFSATRNPTIRP
jgi:ABC-type Fe3+ transport system permease subunit